MSSLRSTKKVKECDFVVFDQFSKMMTLVACKKRITLDSTTKITKSITFHPQMDGQTEVINRIILHIMRMYNSRHPHTWDESLPYVQISYNKSIHSSTGHNPFQVGLNFNHWVPWMLHYPLHPQRKNHPMLKLKTSKTSSSLNKSSTSDRLNIFCRSPMPNTSITMINIGCHTSFR